MDAVPSSQGLDLLFRKLGHDLVEIRTRALGSITSKLEHGLLHEADLVQERPLFIRLLEWFNLHPSPMQDEVFRLLLNLSKHTSACELLVSLGAVKFLTDLRQDLESALKPQLDTLLDRLFHVTDGALSDQSRCTYQKTSEDPMENQQKDTQEDSNQAPHFTSGYFHTDHGSQDMLYLTPPATRNEAPPHEENISYIRFPGFPWHFLTATDRHVLASTSSSLCSMNTHLVRNACSFLLDVVFRDFPAEIFLQRPTILNTLLTLLGSRPNNNLMIATSECLSYISQNLLCRIFYYEDPSMYCPRQGLPIHRSAVPEAYQGGRASSAGTGRGLRSRVDADGGRQERHGGDGRDENSSSSLSSFASSMRDSLNQDPNIFRREDESLEDDHTVALQLAQITTQQFCLLSLRTIVPLLRMDSVPLFLKVYQVALDCVRVLHHILDSDLLWNCSNTAAKSMHSEISSLFEGIGEAVLYHYHLNSTERVYPRSPRGGIYKFADDSEWAVKYESKYDATYHRVAYHACSVLAITFLKSVLPVEKSGPVIKGTLATALYVISCDEALAVSFCDLCAVAETYLEQCSKEKHEVLVRLRRVVKSIAHTHQFLDECKSTDKDIDLALELAQSSIECLPYYKIKGLIQSIIQIISETFNEKLESFSNESSNTETARDILLKLMAHPLTRIRSATYESCFKIAESCLNVTVAAEDPSGNKSYVCNFLLSSSVLYEMCLHGIGDSSVLVSTPAQDLILLLLQSKLLMAESLWSKFRKVLKPVMPILQAFKGETELLRGAIFGLLGYASNECDNLEKIQCLLRAVFIKQRSVRSIAGGMLLQVLTSYRREIVEGIDENENSLSKLLDRTSNIVGLTDLLIVENPMSLACCNPVSRSTGTGLFHEDAVVRMLGIFRSRTIDWPVRRSALQQLSVMLSDPNLHEIFLKSDGLESVKSHLIDLVRENSVLTETERNEADSCVCVIKCIAQWHVDIRYSLYVDHEMLLSLLKMSDLCRLSPLSISQVTATLALILFHDVIQEHKMEEGSDDANVKMRELSLPAGILSRYQIPFLCPSHHVVSMHRTLASPPSQCDPLITGPAAFAIRIASSLAKCEGDVVQTIKLQEDLSSDADPRNKEDQVIFLPQADRIALSYSYPIAAVTGLIESLSSAGSHSGVRHVVSLLRIMLSSCPGQFSSTLFGGDKWRKVLNKFLHVLPSSIEDESLLLDIVNLLDDLIRSLSTWSITMKKLSSESDDTMLETILWLLRICIPEESSPSTDKPLFYILKSSEPQREPFPPSSNQTQGTLSSVTVRRQLCKAILSMLSHVSRKLTFLRNKDIVHQFQALLCQVLLIRLKLADAPQFYDLPSMEVTLECLMHITASSPGWTNAKVLEWQGGHRAATLPTDGTIICRQLTSTLLEVVSAFHIESRGSSMSYMGKGVSRSATQSIVHLIHEIANNAKDNHQIQECLTLLQHVSTTAESSADHRSGHSKPNEGGYDWMLPLWSARDPRIRYSGIALAAVISRTVNGCIVLANSFQEYLGGLWSMSFGVFFDDSECSAVREQAAILLSNLLSHSFDTSPEGGLDSDAIWQGPVVRDDEHETTLTGVSALLALLHHLKLHQHLEVMISHYNSSSSTQPVTILYTPFISSSSYSTSTQNSFLTGPESVSGMDATPITQQSMSTVERSQSFSSDKNATPNVSPSPGNEISENPNRINERQQIDAPVNSVKVGRESVGSIASTLPSEWQALCTPKLKASACSFLANLIVLAPHETINLLEPNGTIQHIAHLIDVPLLSSYLQQLKQHSENSGSSKNEVHVASLASTALSLISQYTETCKVLHAYAYHDKNMAYCLVSDHQILENIFNLLEPVSPFEAWNVNVWKMQEPAMNFLSTAIQLNVSRVGEHIVQIISKDWPSFSKSLQHLISQENNNSLLLSSLRMLSNMLNSLAIYGKQKKLATSFCTLFGHSTGESDASTISTNLIKIFESFVSKPDTDGNFKLLSGCCNALQSLFAVSPASKETAVQSGLLERLLTEIKRCHSKLELFTTNSLAARSRSKSKSKSSTFISSNKDCEEVVKKIVLLLHILNNFLYGSSEIKILANDAALGQMLSKLWGWAPLYPKLLISILKTASSFTAGCETACSSLAASPIGHQSLTGQLVAMARELSSQIFIAIHVQATHLQGTFSLLCNLSLSQECRSIMWKSGFMNEFLTAADKGQHPKRSKQQSALLAYWLKLLHCLSFHTDGQLNILKVSDILEVLLEIRSTSKANSELVMSIIRNLCFHNPSKHRISSNKTVVNHLMNELSPLVAGKSRSKVNSASALWALLSNSQKSKVHLKGAGLSGLIQSTLAHLNQKPVSGLHDDFHTSLTAVLEIIQT